MIETRVEGDVAAVNAAADWLRDTLKKNTDLAGDRQSAARAAARDGWEGSAADGYQAFTRPVVRATDHHVQRIGRAASAIEDYAVRLQQMKRTMRGLRTRAETGGLSVAGTVIQAPASVPAGRVEPGSPEATARQTALDRIELYDTLAEEATTAATDFTDWIDTHLAADLEDAQEKDTVDKALTELESVIPNFAAGAGAGLTGLALMKKAGEYAAERREFRRRSRTSGNPQVRGQADTPSGRAHVDDLASKAGRLGRFGRIFGGPVGIGIDIGFGVKDGIETGDWTRAALTTGTSIAVGVGAAALVAAGVVTAPAWLTVVGAGALAAGAAWGVGKIYDNWDDITDWGGDRVDDVKDFASDTWDKAGDVVGDTWDAVTPW